MSRQGHELPGPVDVERDRRADLAAASGVLATLHPHVGTLVERTGEVWRVLDGCAIPLTLDTGHLLIGGTDPLKLFAVYDGLIYADGASGTVVPQTADSMTTTDAITWKLKIKPGIKFTDDTAIDPIYLERPYYLAPDGPVAREAFAVIREGMKGKAGIGKVALYGREYLVKVQPREQGLVMYTLRHANEIRSMEAIEELTDMPGTVKPEEVKLAKQVMGTFAGDVDLQEYRDDYQVGLREIIDAKIEGREVVAPEVEAPPKVVNLMEALRKSLDSIGAKKKPAAVAPAADEKKRKRA